MVHGESFIRTVAHSILLDDVYDEALPQRLSEIKRNYYYFFSCVCMLQTTMDEIASGAIDENEQERNIIYNSTFIRRQSGLNNNQSSGRSFIREEQKAFMRA